MAADSYDQYGGNGGYGDNIDPNTGLPYGQPPTPDPTVPVAPTTGGGPQGGGGGEGVGTAITYPKARIGVPSYNPGTGWVSQEGESDPNPTPAPWQGGGYVPQQGPYYPGTLLKQDPRFSTLVDQLMTRAQGSLNIDPLTDPIIRPQVDNYGATQTRMARNAIDSQAESGSPYATGSLQNTRNQVNEQAGFHTANLQSSLMTNELTARRKDITDALQESGQLLTADQQMKLQEELGLIDANLKQQGLNSGNDQFLARLGLDSQNQGNYWDAIRSGLIKG